MNDEDVIDPTPTGATKLIVESRDVNQTMCSRRTEIRVVVRTFNMAWVQISRVAVENIRHFRILAEPADALGGPDHVYTVYIVAAWCHKTTSVIQCQSSIQG